MEYTVTVATGTQAHSGTMNCVYVTLVGENGESERTLLDNPGRDLCTGTTADYTVRSSAPLGRVIFVRLEKKWYWCIEDGWFCNYVKVTPPGGGEAQTFPCYSWLVENAKIEIREGTAKKLNDEILHQEVAHRKAQLKERQNKYKWHIWEREVPKCIDAKSVDNLPEDSRFTCEKSWDFKKSQFSGFIDMKLTELYKIIGCSWKDLDDIKPCWKEQKPMAEHVKKHWKEDSFFGYQFLNGPNPRMIKKCFQLPCNFPVSEDMVQPFLSSKTTLTTALKDGNIYLADYAILNGVPANVIDGKHQYIAAPLCLLYEHPDKGLIPIAIQLEQYPVEDTPIFLPNDPDLAWLLAKLWVRNAEFQVFEVLSHLLKTHIIAEVFCVATMRHLPSVHPLYKLLISHLRYTLEINVLARTQLISKDGIFKQVVSTGGKGLLVLSQKECDILTYRSLQPRLDFEDRGVTELNKYFYRDHALMVWDAIESFVSSIVSLYYTCDVEVVKDSELQAWIKDVVDEGFFNCPNFGLPNELKNKEELVTLLSVVIFTTSAQHAATNNGQFDFCAWMPNAPCTMRQPPPTDKDSVTMKLIMDTLPDISQSCVQATITWLLARTPPDAEYLGHYVEQYFTEPEALRIIDEFKEKLKDVEVKIAVQNLGLEPPYLYLSPNQIENSITT